MLSQTTKLKGVKLIKEQYTNELHEWRMETYSWIKYNGLGIKTLFTVDYETTVKFKNTLRGLYFQNNPLQQALLIRCVQGEILQAVVDLRSTSKQYGQWSLFHLRGEDLNEHLYPWRVCTRIFDIDRRCKNTLIKLISLVVLILRRC